MKLLTAATIAATLLFAGSAGAAQIVQVKGIPSAGDSARKPSGPPKPGAAVPEPASWALMLVGFGGMGALLRYQRRKLAPTT
jgi:hypothetical protein